MAELKDVRPGDRLFLKDRKRGVVTVISVTDEKNIETDHGSITLNDIAGWDLAGDLFNAKGG